MMQYILLMLWSCKWMHGITTSLARLNLMYKRLPRLKMVYSLSLPCWNRGSYEMTFSRFLKAVRNWYRKYWILEESITFHQTKNNLFMSELENLFKRCSSEKLTWGSPAAVSFQLHNLNMHFMQSHFVLRWGPLKMSMFKNNPPLKSWLYLSGWLANYFAWPF